MGTDGAEWDARQARQAEAFDRIGERYDEAFPHKDSQIAATRRLLGVLPAGAHVLDVGCGTGLPTARQFVDAGCGVTGVDLSPAMVDLARRNVPQARFLCADMTELDGIDGLGASFDAVVAYFALLMLPRARIPGALRQIRRVLVPGGWFGVSMVEADIDDTPIPFLGQRVLVTGYTREALRDLLAAAGFGIESEDSVDYAPASPDAPPETQLFVTCRARE